MSLFLTGHILPRIGMGHLLLWLLNEQSKRSSAVTFKTWLNQICSHSFSLPNISKMRSRIRCGFTVTWFCLRPTSRHIRLQHANIVIHTSIWDNQWAANSFKFDHAVNWTQDRTCKRGVWMHSLPLDQRHSQITRWLLLAKAVKLKKKFVNK